MVEFVAELRKHVLLGCVDCDSFTKSGKNRLHLNVLQWPNLKLSSQKWHLQFPTQVCGRYGNDGQVFGQDDDLHCGAYK